MSLLFNNDTGFIESLYDQYSREIYLICFSYCKNKADAEDCLLDVFFRAMSKTREVMKHPAPDKWLFVTARLVSLEKLRANNKANRNEMKIEDFETALQSEAFEDTLFERQYTETEILLLRNDILDTLNGKERELYTLRYVDKLNIGVIAKRLNITYSNATTRINRLKEKIIKMTSKIFCD